MKTVILNLLKRAKNTPYYIWLWISLPILAILLSILFGDIAKRNPRGILDTIIFLLMIAFFLGFIIFLFFQKEKSPPVSHSEKPKKTEKTKRPSKIKHLMPQDKIIRLFFFILLGTLCMLYCIISFPFFHGIEKFNRIFRISTFLFIVVYPLTFALISRIFSKSKEEEIDNTFPAGQDTLAYIAGLFSGLIIFIVLGVISLIVFAGIKSVKGVIWLIGFFSTWEQTGKFFGILSALVVLASYPVYIVRIWQRKIVPNISSWTIFVIVSVALCLSSYSSSGAGTNSWVTLGPLIGCLAILISALIRSKEKSIKIFDIVCLLSAILSIAFWYFTRQNRELVQYALYLGILTDFIGLLPSINFLTKNPEKDRPAMWFIFSIGYLLSMPAITEHTFANWFLPSFMVVAPAFVWVPLMKYRVKNKIPIREWI